MVEHDNAPLDGIVAVGGLPGSTSLNLFPRLSTADSLLKYTLGDSSYKIDDM
jgi:hypothetical protein